MMKTDILTLELNVDKDTVLVPVTTDHANQLWNQISANYGDLGEWLGWVDKVRTLADTRRLCKIYQEKYTNTGAQTFTVFFKDTPAGVVGMNYLDYAERSTGLGYWLGAAFQGQGIMTSSCQVLIDHIFSSASIDVIQILCATDNIPSQAIPKRLGFDLQSVIPNGEKLPHKTVDLLQYTLRRQQVIKRLERFSG